MTNQEIAILVEHDRVRGILRLALTLQPSELSADLLAHYIKAVDMCKVSGQLRIFAVESLKVTFGIDEVLQ